MEWNAPLDDVTSFALLDAKQDIRLFPFMTARIIDAAQQLAALTYPENAEGSIGFQITDELAPWNEQFFVLHVANGRGKVSYDTDHQPELHCSIGALTQLLFGRLSALQLKAMGRITADDSTLQRLNTWFPPCDNFINEYY